MFVSDSKFILGVTVFLLVGLWWYIGVAAAPQFYWVDIVLHFWGGVLVLALFLNFFKNRPQLFDLSRNKLVSFLFVASFVALIGLLWEFYEYANDYLFIQWLSSSPTQFTLADTLSDLFFDLLGGVIAMAVYLLI